MEVFIAKRTLTVFLLSLFVLLLGAACGGDQEAAGGGGEEATSGGGEEMTVGGEEAVVVGEFNDWDLNNNDELTQKEFNQSIDDVIFDEWDADNNNLVGEKEFQAGMEKPKG